jgi:hypothetical protein
MSLKPSLLSALTLTHWAGDMTFGQDADLFRCACDTSHSPCPRRKLAIWRNRWHLIELAPQTWTAKVSAMNMKDYIHVVTTIACVTTSWSDSHFKKKWSENYKIILSASALLFLNGLLKCHGSQVSTWGWHEVNWRQE